MRLIFSDDTCSSGSWVSSRRPSAAPKSRSLRIVRSIALKGEVGRVVLYAWGATDELRMENVACLEPDGSVRWRASLPEGLLDDCFNGLEDDGVGVLASTWSGLRMRLDPVTGGATKV